MATIIQVAVDSVQPLLEQKGLQIETTCDSRSVVVSADPERMQQVIWNLLINAIKFSPQDSKISVSLDCVDGNAKIQVRDTGKGIKPEFVPKLFDRFSQADNTNIREHGGLGLGLAIVKNLVSLQGGTVSAESRGEGKGATFTVTIPLVTTSQTPETRTHPLFIHEASQEEEPTRLDGLRVLVVDDDELGREAFCVMLNSVGAAVNGVESASAALEVLPNLRPDVLVSDIAMPGEDGYSLIRKIRKLGPEQGGQTPAIALTAYAGSEDMKCALAAGFEMHIGKPTTSATLTRAIAKLAERTPQS